MNQANIMVQSSSDRNAEKLAVFEESMRSQIPLVNHLGFQQLEYNGNTLSISAALESNHNDKGTAFAGSLAAVGNLCGWGLITLHLEDEEGDYDVVIRDSRLEYFRPITADFTLTASFSDSEGVVVDVDAFVEKLRKKGRARVDVGVEVMEEGKLCFRLSGAYVALRKKQWL